MCTAAGPDYRVMPPGQRATCLTALTSCSYRARHAAKQSLYGLLAERLECVEHPVDLIEIQAVEVGLLRVAPFLAFS
jgi:hypothetical protein